MPIMSTRGRVTIPKKIRDTLGIKHGDQFNLRLIHPGVILAERVVPTSGKKTGRRPKRNHSGQSKSSAKAS
jgi:AbrB family looped-hinge helix DNA binding protein